jgi:2-hydroxychromene-2-carboxylate isomerase
MPDASRETLKLYFDYKSPYAYLAARPALDLPQRYDVAIRWMPFQLRIKGRGQRSLYSEWKVRYSYMDARRWANRRGGFTIRGPRKVYDSTASLIGALYAQREGAARLEACIDEAHEDQIFGVPIILAAGRALLGPRPDPAPRGAARGAGPRDVAAASQGERTRDQLIRCCRCVHRGACQSVYPGPAVGRSCA